MSKTTGVGRYDVIPANQLLCGDALAVLKTLPENSVHCVVTSPPYFGLRDYSIEGQIGQEKSPTEFTAKLVAIFNEVRRVLRADGTCWLNLGDSYSGSWGNYGGKNRGNGTQRKITTGSVVKDQTERNGLYRPATAKIDGLKPKDLIGIPWRVAFALQASGWYLRQDIIWAKPNPMPESVRDRCTKSHEYIFLLTKSEHYVYDAKAIAEPVTISTISRLSQKNLQNQNGSTRVPGKTNGNMKAVGSRFSSKNGQTSFRGQGGNRPGRDMSTIGTNDLRNARSVWSIPTRPCKEAHFATFPQNLAERCILAGCPVGGLVLDPFSGAGTTALVASMLGRDYLGIELNPAYNEIAKRRLGLFAPQEAN